ncbi:PREDICTED: E3 ubiquitin-protein ligase RGLG2-like isoform X2 [Nelumbo nucifera]|uniref:E3 ubiquitin-protein ligase RGLG2-like isoform X2 n=1 Tax=Nelumbo nucifera TaxID=4432 RepID=A0A1U7Z768_NELNU|nr:PREDICTED: E3 ubiquitin-protein ligase RGLG2-like isoform X2 [Nelumbo nucifera]
MAMVEKSGGQYHVLLIITDGQVPSGHPQKKMTLNTIARASTYPLFVILIGVGDGPWNMMKEFAKKKIPDRVVDNIQFVNFTEIMSSNNHNKEIEFAQAALIGIRGHYEEAVRLDLLGHQKLQAQIRAPLRPPLPVPDSIRNSINLLLCPICLTNSKDLAFGCGHQTCSQCGQGLLLSCPICRSRIDTRIKLYYHMC